MEQLPNPGEFVNLHDWFGDVWAEVLWSTSYSCTLVRYSKYGNERYTSSATKEEIRKVLVERPEHYGVLYTDRTYDGGWPGRQALWPTSAREENTKLLYTSNYREHLAHNAPVA